MSTEHTPLVTVYVTSHNYGRYIEQAIESVLNQTMHDFELIIIDDGSTDNSRDIIQAYAEHDRVIPVFQQNKGLNVTNNIAMRMARGRYIMRLDADDWLDEHALKVMSDALERDPEVGLVFPDYYHVDEGGCVIEAVRRHDFGDVTMHDQPAHGACTMIRRQCLLDIDGYDESFRCQDGYDLWIRFIEHFKVENVNLPLFYYRQHGKSLTAREERILATRGQIIERQSRVKDKDLTTFAIIPVRGGVTQPESLALQKLGGKALIDWTVQAALDARHVRDVVVTTPDPAVIAHIAKTFGDAVICLDRDPTLAMPNTYIEDTLLDAIARYGAGRDVPDALVHLSVRVPFRPGSLIDTAIEVLHLFSTDTVIGVRPETDMFYQHDGNGLAPIRKTSRLRLEREEVYREAGGLRAIRRALLETEMTTVGGRVGHVVCDQKAAFHLSSALDWDIAEFLVGHDAPA